MPDQELTVCQEQALATHRPADMMQAISRAAMDPTVDVAKMQALLDMAERMQATAARVEYQAAMARLQAKMPRIEKDGAIVVSGQTRSRYATLENIDRILKPLLAEEGFAISFDTKVVDNKLVVEGRVTHAAGHSEVKQVPLALDTSGSKNGTQATGSTITYGQRYLIKMLFNIVEVGLDQDGEQPLEPITQDQVIAINDMIRESGANVAKLLEWADAKTVADIPANKYGQVVAELKRKMELKRRG